MAGVVGLGFSSGACTPVEAQRPASLFNFGSLRIFSEGSVECRASASVAGEAATAFPWRRRPRLFAPPLAISSPFPHPDGARWPQKALGTFCIFPLARACSCAESVPVRTGSFVYCTFYFLFYVGYCITSLQFYLVFVFFFNVELFTRVFLSFVYGLCCLRKVHDDDYKIDLPFLYDAVGCKIPIENFCKLILLGLMNDSGSMMLYIYVFVSKT